jgi:D-alanyl-D-alanine carboxypeptidase
MRRQMAHRAGAHPTTRDPRGLRRFIGPAILGIVGIAIALAVFGNPGPATADPHGDVAGLTSAPATPAAAAPAALGGAPTAPPCAFGDEPTADRDPDGWASTILDTTLMLPETYVPTGLVPVTEAGIEGRGKVRELVIDDLRALAVAAATDGVAIGVDSAYRSYDQQVLSYESYVQGYGEAAARLTVARPGHSEHQLGTTVDFTGDLAWLAAHAPGFGFVMSYPADRSPERSCYRDEAWHFRYVGRERAALVTQSGLSLREWLWANRP